MGKIKKVKTEVEEPKGIPSLVKLGITAGIVIILFGGLYIVDSYQKYVREQNSTHEELDTYDSSIKGIDVDGMSEEEIQAALEAERAERGVPTSSESSTEVGE